MNKYDSHFLMDCESVKDYCIDYLHFFDRDEKLLSEEIGDGNINYVFRIKSLDRNKSLVIKQADRLLRSSGRPLDLHRNKIEAAILNIEGELAEGFVPKIYNYNENMFALAMEDISDYKNLRKELLEGRKFIHLSENISTFLAKTLMPTTDLVLSRDEKKKRVQLFTNIELCDITEDLVFTEPYYNYKNRNIITQDNEEFVSKTLYNDEKLKSNVGYLRNNFMNNTQALIHGDLHSGSIFINDDGIKVIDPEFAFYGPMGYDIGNVIGNLFFVLINKVCTQPKNQNFIDYIKNTIIDTLNLTMKKLESEFISLVELPIYNEIFRQEYLRDVLSDSIGYAGTEMIRRTVGDSKVLEVTSVTDIDTRIRLERLLVLCGARFIKERKNINSGEELILIFKEVLEQYGI